MSVDVFTAFMCPVVLPELSANTELMRFWRAASKNNVRVLLIVTLSHATT